MNARFIVTLFLVLCGTTATSGEITTPDPTSMFPPTTDDPVFTTDTVTTPDPDTAAPTDTVTTSDPTTADLTTTTDIPTTATNAPTTTTEEPTTTTTDAPTTATRAASTTVTTTAAATTTAAVTVSQTVRLVVFRSLTANFTTDLLDSSSDAFKARASLIQNQLGPIFSRNFLESFISLVVASFSNGSIINTMNVAFKTANAPNATAIATVMLNAASNVTGFDIEQSSITVDGTISAAVSHKFSLLTAFFLVLSSWLLTSHH